jgi:hypothetical protein
MNIKTFGRALVFVLLASAVQAQPIENAVPDVARPLPLIAVRVTGGPLKRAQDLNAEYLLKLEPDRMMAQSSTITAHSQSRWDHHRQRSSFSPKEVQSNEPVDL